LRSFHWAWAALAIAVALPAAADAADLLRVGKPFATGFDFAILQVGIDANIFKKHDIDIDTETLSGSAKLHQGMISNSIDIALGAGTDFSFIAKGAPEKGVAAMAGAPLNICVVVRSDGSIKSIADLKGKKVGVSSLVSLTYWLGQQLSHQQGWGPKGLVFAETGSGQSSVAALLSGGIDAMVGSLEGGLVLEKAGKGRVLTTFGSINPFLTHMISATDSLMSKNPDALRRFLAAWFETVAFMKANKEEAIRLSEPVTKLSPDIAEKVYQIEMPMYFTDGHFDPHAVDAVKRALIETGQMTTMPENSALYTERFLK
jgi:ABC-type nitrate/sulfonate/bicarbonate transport system substrate-binding protein